MVQAVIKISNEANRIVNIVKAKENLKDKSAAIELIVRMYGHDLLEPQLRPEFIKKMRSRSTEPTVKIDDFDAHFGVK